MSRVEQHLDKRLADFEEQLGDKASKQSVAQALHRKLNKQEFDEMLTKKADLQDIQRVLTALDSKVDSTSFNQIVKAIENKADKFEIQAVNKGADAEVSNKVHKLTSEFNDMDKKVDDMERAMQRLIKDSDAELENLRQ